MLEKDGKTHWHHLVGETLKVLLEPVGIEVRTEVPVVPAPPIADLILIQRKEVGARGWTQEQCLRLADGLRDLDLRGIWSDCRRFMEVKNEKCLE
ncbi:MAG: hypothetical protein HQL75_03450 [Magnetococcales bacterium]|nr:hypothetical protein [Magnetococcales bacterium]